MTGEFGQLKILYEDAGILVCVKPSGIASETKRAGQQDMVSLLRNYRSRKGEEPYIGLVHRLDQPVEGVLVFGKHTHSSAALSRQLAQGDFLKEYLAVTEGKMPQEGKLTDYLKKDGRSNTSYVVSRAAAQNDKLAKKAELYFQVLETLQDESMVYNLVKIRLLTGRHHQIRVQMAHLGAPLTGDRKYGGAKKCGNEPGGNTGIRKESGLGLCAAALEFVHPVTNKPMKFEIAPSGAAFQKFGSCPKN